MSQSSATGCHSMKQALSLGMWNTDFGRDNNHLIHSFHKYLLAPTTFQASFYVLKQTDLINIVCWKKIHSMKE